MRSKWIGLGLAALMLAGCQQPQSGGTAQAPTSSAAAAGPVASSGAPMVAPQPASGTLGDMERNLQDVYGRLNPSVVNLNVSGKVSRPTMGGPDGDLPFSFPFPFGPDRNPRRNPGPQGPQGPQEDAPELYQRGSGSGFVWDGKGHIVTNNHVVADADTIWVTFSDGAVVKGTKVGADPDSDLAVIKVDPAKTKLAPVTLADSTKLKVGSMAIALGNPFGLKGTMTVGFVSGLGRLFPTDPSRPGPGYSIPDMIQTDASINPGNSGGVLADAAGNVVGVTSAILSPSGANAGVGFAIPSAIVAKVVPVLIASGKFEHPYIGVVGLTLLPELAKAMGLPESQRGGLISEVMPGGPGAKAKLRGSDKKVTIEGDEMEVGGDVITAFNGETVNTFDDIVTLLARYGQVGQSITLTVLRDGKPVEVKVQLEARKTPAATAPDEQPSSAQPQPPAGPPQRQPMPVTLGLEGRDLSSEINQAAGLDANQKGVLVQSISVGSPADKAGLRGGDKSAANLPDLRLGGDVIVAIGGQEVTGLDSVRAQLAKLQPGAKTAVTVLRGGQKVDLTVSFPTS